MDFQYNTIILNEGLIPAVDKVLGDARTLQQDNAPIHTAKHTRNWLESNDVHVLDWPAQSSDLIVIENVWEAVL